MHQAVLAATVPDSITFSVAAVISVVGALGVVLSRNPIHSALMLVMTLFGVAVLFVEENAQFLAAVQVIVYAGAIVVLFLFVIMLLGVDRREVAERDPLPAQRGLAILLGVLTLAEVILLAKGHWPTGAHSVSGAINVKGTSNTALLGDSVFTAYLLPFEITSALLVIAVIGAVVLARRPRRPEDAEQPQIVGGGDVTDAGTEAEVARVGAPASGYGEEASGSEPDRREP